MSKTIKRSVSKTKAKPKELLPLKGKRKKKLPIKGKELLPLKPKISPTQAKIRKARLKNVSHSPIPKGWLSAGEVTTILGFIDPAYVGRLCQGGGLVGEPKLIGKKFAITPGGMIAWFVDPASVRDFQARGKPVRGRTRGVPLCKKKPRNKK